MTGAQALARCAGLFASGKPAYAPHTRKRTEVGSRSVCRELAAKVIQLVRHAEQLYTPEVDALLREQCRDD